MSEQIEIQVNGESCRVPAGMAVPALLAHLGLAENRVAIERNRDVLPRPEWASTEVESGDRLEIVHLVGGGSREFSGLSGGAR